MGQGGSVHCGMLGILLTQQTPGTPFPLPLSTGNQTTLLKLGRVPSGGSKSFQGEWRDFKPLYICKPTYMYFKTEPYQADLQVQPKCSGCKHADCSPSQGGSGLSFTLFLGYGGSNHWALRRTKPPSHSRHVACLCDYITSSTKRKSNFLHSRRINNTLALFRSSFTLRDIGPEEEPPWIQSLPSTSQQLLNYKHSLRIPKQLYR